MRLRTSSPFGKVQQLMYYVDETGAAFYFFKCSSRVILLDELLVALHPVLDGGADKDLLLDGQGVGVLGEGERVGQWQRVHFLHGGRPVAVDAHGRQLALDKVALASGVIEHVAVVEVQHV